MTSLKAILTSLETHGYLAPGQAALANPEDVFGPPGALENANALAQRLDRCVVLGPSPLPFTDFLQQRASAETTTLCPLDSETSVFLQDIPLFHAPFSSEELASALTHRKVVLARGIGVVTSAATWQECSLYLACAHHALFVTYLAERLDQGAKLDAERELPCILAPLATKIPDYSLPDSVNQAVLSEAGKAMVELGLVDSVFGNASYRMGEQICISRTGAPLDALKEGTTEVLREAASDKDKEASSELPAHRTIYNRTSAQVILHGHPRFCIAASLSDSFTTWPSTIPRIQAEPGSQDLGDKLAAALMDATIAMADGHGPFAIGATFQEALAQLIQLENHCRQMILKRLS